jgi:hypothetical protein
LEPATKILILTPVRHEYHESARFKEAATFFLKISQRALARCVVALNVGVMRRFERVVALPDPKDREFPQPQQHFR